MKDSLSFQRVGALFFLLFFLPPFLFLLLKDGVKGVLTVAPGGESLPRRFNNVCGSNNVPPPSGGGIERQAGVGGDAPGVVPV